MLYNWNDLTLTDDNGIVGPMPSEFTLAEAIDLLTDEEVLVVVSFDTVSLEVVRHERNEETGLTLNATGDGPLRITETRNLKIIPKGPTQAQRTIASMVPPRKVRPQVWKGGVLQIHVTRASDKSCFGCTQGSNLAGKLTMITVENFEKACQSLKGYFGVVGVFGGNPAKHPQFDELCSILREYFPRERRGLWCNNLMGKRKHARVTFNPAVSNLNVHLDREAYDEFRRDWPEARPFGLENDSRHSPPYVAMQDVISDEDERWRLIGQQCDVNRNWSAMVCQFRGELRGFFCELAGAQTMLHENDPDYLDLGVPAVPGWWN